jgi:thioesterase domain-containing protein
MHLDQIEPFRTLDFALDEAEAERVVMSVPLDGNRNDKGTMFGGSVYSAMVLAGWTLCIEQGKAVGRDGDIVIKDSSVAFLRPVTGRLRVTATPAGAPAQTRSGHLAFRIHVVADDADGQRCAEFEGNYRLLGAAPATG